MGSMEKAKRGVVNEHGKLEFMMCILLGEM